MTEYTVSNPGTILIVFWITFILTYFTTYWIKKYPPIVEIALFTGLINVLFFIKIKNKED